MSEMTTRSARTTTFADAWDVPQTSALSQAELDRLTDDIIEALKTVFDPEIPVDIYELGLIYKVDLSDDRDVADRDDPDGPGLSGGRRDAGLGRGRGDEGRRASSPRRADLVFDPPWDPSQDERRGQAGPEHVLSDAHDRTSDHAPVPAARAPRSSP